MKRVTLKAVILVFLLFNFSLTAFAIDKYWAGESGSWSDDNNWNPIGTPTINDNAFLFSNDKTDRTVFVDGHIGDIWSMEIDAVGKGTMTLELSAGSSGFFILGPKIGIDGTGIINQSDGSSFGFSTYASVGVHQGSLGVYNLNGGFFGSKTGGLQVGNEGEGIFNQTAGSVRLDSLSVGPKGTYNITNGYLSTDPVGGMFAIRGVFNQSGGLVYADKPSITGEYNFSGGELQTSQGPKFGFRNDGAFNISGNGTRKITGDVFNNGAVKTTKTSAVFNGNFTNNGSYVSNHADQYFNDLLIGKTGYLKGGQLDSFYISGDFINNSLMKYDWNTRYAYLGFTDGLDNIHDFYLAGADLGDAKANFTNNFAWGTLDISRDIIRLFDGNSELGAALYVDDLLGAIIQNGTVTNIFGSDGIVVYYDPRDKANRYLAGLDYRLTGGGYLRAEGPEGTVASVPEPTTVILLGIGLIGLAGYGRKKLS